jgi:hypothetical protein
VQEGPGRPVGYYKSSSVDELAAQQGVSGVTARNKVALAEELEDRPVLS